MKINFEFCIFGSMEISGNIRKMEVSQGDVVEYRLPLGSKKDIY